MNVQSAASPVAISAAMVSGKSQFGFITTPVLVNANLANTKMKCVASVAGQASATRHANALVVSKKSGITSLKGLAGKKFAVVQLGSQNKLSAEMMFRDAGVKGVQYVAIPFPQMEQALADGRVDGAIISWVYAEKGISSGSTIALGHPTSDLWADGTIYCFAAMSNYLDKNADVAKAFQAAMNESILYTKDHEPEVLKSLVTHMKLSPEDAAKQDIPSNFVPGINKQSIAEIQDEMKNQGWIKSTVNPDELVWESGS